MRKFYILCILFISLQTLAACAMFRADVDYKSALCFTTNESIKTIRHQTDITPEEIEAPKESVK